MMSLGFPPPKSPSNESDGILLSPSTDSMHSTSRAPSPERNELSTISERTEALTPPCLTSTLPIIIPPQRLRPSMPPSVKPRLPKVASSDLLSSMATPQNLPSITHVGWGSVSGWGSMQAAPTVVSPQDPPKKASTPPSTATKPRLPKFVRITSPSPPLSSSSGSRTPPPIIVPPMVHHTPTVYSSPRGIQSHARPLVSPMIPPAWGAPSANADSYSPAWGWPAPPAPPSWPPAAPASMAPLMPPLYGAAKYHERFFFSDGNVAFQTWDGTIYKVHRYHFDQHSTVLASRIPASFTYSTPENYPVTLHDVEPRAFELLLSIFYPKDFLTYELETVDDWRKLLAVANKYSMTKIKYLAIDRLGSIASPVDKIALANDYDIQEWLIPAFTELCLRDEPLTFEEGIQLGVDSIIKIGQLKYEITDNLKKYVDNAKVRKAVEESLAEEDMGSEGSY